MPMSGLWVYLSPAQPISPYTGWTALASTSSPHGALNAPRFWKRGFAAMMSPPENEPSAHIAYLPVADRPAPVGEPMHLNPRSNNLVTQSFPRLNDSIHYGVGNSALPVTSKSP